MKNEILKRAMFAMPLSKESRNSGIMAGFEEEMPEEPEEGTEEMPQMARTPQNPEILMNTLRGDMRSVDARVQELAQLVGEQAAMDTPPEVLAMLQPQLAAQQGGIGALPQGQGMAPPPMGMPPEGGMPPEAGMPPQGGIPMPQGMEGAGPFPQGGAEQAPPTPDGMPPMQAALGAFITPATRMAQMAGDKLGQYGSAANAALGRMFMNPQGITQPTLQNLVGPNKDLVYPNYTRVAGGELLTPTFTQGLVQGTAKLADQYPRLASMLAPAAGALGLANAPRGGPSGPGTDLMSQIPTDTIKDRVANSVLNKPPILTMGMEGPFTTTDPDRVKITTGPRPTPAVEAPAAAESAAFNPLAMQPVRPDEFGALAEVGEEKKSTQEFIKAAVKEKTRAERTKEGYAELAPLFQEILGDNKEDMKTNALLMLADAGFKLASSRQPTFAMAVGEAASGMPRGFMALMAQSKDRDLKIKSAALSQAFTDVQEQDKYAQQTKMEVLKGDFRLLLEQIKNGSGNIISKDGGAGLRIAETKNGSFIDAKIDPSDPTVQTAVRSRFTLRDTDNPFVENRGEAPTAMETDKGERLKLTASLRALDDSLSRLDNLKGTYAQLYSPGTWFQDKINNILVPISGGLIRPDVNQAAAQQQLTAGLQDVMKGLAKANDNGRVAVQEQQWVRDNNGNILFPVGFLENKELAAKSIEGLYTDAVNARQRVLTQLGYEKNDYVRRVASTGTQNDPFVIPQDPEQRQIMKTFLTSTIGRIQDPKATVTLKMPDNSLRNVSPPDLLRLMGSE